MNTARWTRLRTWKTAAAAAVAVAVAVTVCLWWPWGGDSRLPDPRARVYRDVDACLLTGQTGITAGTPGAAVWAGMERASTRTRARVSYTPVTGEQSAGNAGPYLNTLLQHCAVVVAVGRAQVGVAQEAAKSHPRVRFVVVDGTASAANVTAVRSGTGVTAGVADAVARTVGDGD